MLFSNLRRSTAWLVLAVGLSMPTPGMAETPTDRLVAAWRAVLDDPDPAVRSQAWYGLDALRTSQTGAYPAMVGALLLRERGRIVSVLEEFRGGQTPAGSRSRDLDDAEGRELARVASRIGALAALVVASDPRTGRGTAVPGHWGDSTWQVIVRRAATAETARPSLPSAAPAERAIVANAYAEQAKRVGEQLDSGRDTAGAVDGLLTVSETDSSLVRPILIRHRTRLTSLMRDPAHLSSVSALLLAVDEPEMRATIRAELMAIAQAANVRWSDACWFAATLPTDDRLPVAVSLLARSAESSRERAEHAACIRALLRTGPEMLLLRDLKLDQPPELAQGAQRERLELLEKLWPSLDPLPPDLRSTVQQQLLREADRLAPALPFLDAAAVATLRRWALRQERVAPDFLSRFEWEAGLRWLSLIVPGAAGLVGMWTACLVALLLAPASHGFRMWFLFSPIGRRLVGLGYIQTMLFAVPSWRRRFFAPYRDRMLGSLAQSEGTHADSRFYFMGSGVARLERRNLDSQARRLERDAVSGTGQPSHSVVEQLTRWAGQVFLVGPSGRGKTTFVRQHLLNTANGRPAVFLSASECGSGPLAAVARKFDGAMNDPDFMESLIKSGKIDLYIDGLNEVDADTRNLILDFVAACEKGNILATTQQLDRYPAGAQLYWLLPLNREQITEFLETRDTTAWDGAEVNELVYAQTAKAFVSETLEAASVPDDSGEAADRARALVERLANPMDLQTAAELIARDRRPDLLNLQEQRHQVVADLYRRLEGGQEFPFATFSRAVYEARRDGRVDVDPGRFPREVDVLLREKQISRRISNGAVSAAEGFVFRHDKIRDYYTYQVFLNDPDVRFQHVGDDAFAGVYDLLVVKLPEREARDLRDYLHEKALDRADHRLSDRYLEGLRTRRAFEVRDPDWLGAFDDPGTKRALTRWDELDRTRRQIGEGLHAAAQTADALRGRVRSLTASSSETLHDSVELLLADHGVTASGPKSLLGRSYVHTASGHVLRVVAVAYHGSLAPGMLAAAKLACQGAELDTLVVVNAEADLPPTERGRGSLGAAREQLCGYRVKVVSSALLLAVTREVNQSPESWTTVWERLSCHDEEAATDGHIGRIRAHT